MSTLVIGTYTEALPHVDGHAQGIFGLTVKGGIPSQAHLLAVTRNPAWVVANSGGDRLYATNELLVSGNVVALALGDGAATALNSFPSEGGEPAHLALDPSGRFLLVADYGTSTVASFALADDGSLGERRAVVHHEGTGPDPDRQTAAHPHQVVFEQSTGLAWVVDLGADTVYCYRLEDDGSLVEQARLPTPPGSGPRHLVFHPDGIHLFVVCELVSSVVVFRRGADGFAAVASIPVAVEGSTARPHPGGIQLDAAGRRLWVSVRGVDAIVSFAFDPAGSALLEVGAVASGGRTPRDILLLAGEEWLAVANQDSDDVTLFAVRDDGTLEPAGRATVASPACILELSQA